MALPVQNYLCRLFCYTPTDHVILADMLYTRKGDKGTTTIFGCNQRMSKASPLPEALGVLDELNSFVGLCRANLVEDYKVPSGKSRKSITNILHDVQEVLFIIQAEVAGAGKKVTKAKVGGLERVVDAVELEIPPLHAFSLSGGTRLSALFDVARTLARRAERRVIALHEGDVQKVSAHTLEYLNRLSSLFFALARHDNHLHDVKEEAPKYR
jgi:cob(I)alamin adenosyltransferase